MGVVERKIEKGTLVDTLVGEEIMVVGEVELEV